MADNAQSTSTQSVQNDTSLEAVRIQEQELNRLLGLNIPRGILTETIPLWQRLFSLMRLMYEAKLIEVADVQNYVSVFQEIPDEDKDPYLVNVGSLVSQKLQQNVILEEAYLQSQIRLEVDRIANFLPVEIRDTVLDYLTQGQELPLNLEAQVNDQLHNMGEDEVLNRLQNALDRRKTLDTRKIKLGEALTPIDVVSRFNLDETRDMTPTPQIQSNSNVSLNRNLPVQPTVSNNPNQRLQPVLPNLPRNPQPRVAAPTQQPATDNRIPPQSIPLSQDAVPSSYMRKPKDLNDLLSKK